MKKYSPHKYSRPGGKQSLAARLGGIVCNLMPRRRKGKKLQAGQVKAMQRSLFARRLGRCGLCFCALLLAAASVLWGGSLLLSHTTLFRLTEIKVEPKNKELNKKVVDAARLELGQSLLSINSGAVERKVTALPWVASAKLTKRWPSLVEIEVKQHRPLAMINVQTLQGNRLVYLNKKGEMFSLHEPGEDIDYPVITGLQINAAEIPDALPKDHAVHSALMLLKLAARGNAILPIQNISEVHVENDDMIVYLVDHPFPIYFGTEEVFTKYYRLVKILERLYRKDLVSDIEVIRMDYLKNKVLVATAESD